MASLMETGPLGSFHNNEMLWKVERFVFPVHLHGCRDTASTVQIKYIWPDTRGWNHLSLYYCLFEDNYTFSNRDG